MQITSLIAPANNKFYEWFEEAAENNYKAAKELEKLCEHFKNPQEISKKIHRLENVGDEICHKIYDELHKSFITPIDREDINSLVRAIDDVVDLIDACANNLDTYNIKKVTPSAVKFAKIITQSTKEVHIVIPALRKRKDFSQITKAIVEINKLENEADILLQTSLKSLFKNPKKAIEIIKWHNIYETMERVTDKCEDISDVLRRLITKYA